MSRPAGYNTSLFPITVDLYLDPGCRYEISATNSFGQTASRIFLQFSHWIPAHIVAILLLALRYQIQITPQKEIFKCGPLSTALLAGQTFFIITGKLITTDWRNVNVLQSLISLHLISIPACRTRHKMEQNPSGSRSF